MVHEHGKVEEILNGLDFLRPEILYLHNVDILNKGMKKFGAKNEF